MTSLADSLPNVPLPTSTQNSSPSYSSLPSGLVPSALLPPVLDITPQGVMPHPLAFTSPLVSFVGGQEPPLSFSGGMPAGMPPATPAAAQGVIHDTLMHDASSPPPISLGSASQPSTPGAPSFGLNAPTSSSAAIVHTRPLHTALAVPSRAAAGVPQFTYNDGSSILPVAAQPASQHGPLSSLPPAIPAGSFSTAGLTKLPSLAGTNLFVSPSSNDNVTPSRTIPTTIPIPTPLPMRSLSIAAEPVLQQKFRLPNANQTAPASNEPVTKNSAPASDGRNSSTQ